MAKQKKSKISNQNNSDLNKNKTNNFYESVRFKMGLSFTAILITIIATIEIIGNIRSINLTNKNLENKFTITAEAAKGYIDIEYISLLVEQKNSETEYYNKTLQSLLKLKKASELEEIQFVYLTSDKIISIFDTGNSTGNMTNPFTEILEDNQYFKDVLQNGKPETTKTYVKHNINVRSYLFPIIDSSNKRVEGIIIIDYSSRKLQLEIITKIIESIIELSIAIFISLIIINYLIHRIFLKPVEDMVKKTKEISKGDLTVKFDYTKHNEIGNLVYSFSDMVETLKNLNQKIYIAVSILTKNLRTLFKSANIVKDAANTQAVTVEQTQSNFENMNKMVETISIESTKANNYAMQGLERAKIGMESMKKLETEMLKIESSSMEISDIINMINEIAEQTNLLSLNASIESARAGEAGKGFNIVAGEIRKLAEKSTQAADRIHKLITNNNAIIKEGVKYSKQTTNILSDIATANELITGLVKTITEEVNKVQFSSKEILQAIDHISNIAQKNLTESENVTTAMVDFVEQTLELQKFVGQFDVRGDHAKENHMHIEEILKAKLDETDVIIKELGDSFLPTGETALVGKKYRVQELILGNHIITNSTEVVDAISKRTHTSVTIFQTTDNLLVRVATTVRNFDDTRATGTAIDSDSPIYQTIMQGKTYYGRAFVVNRWYVAVYKPIQDETGYVLGVLYLGIPEKMDEDEEYKENVGIVQDNTFSIEKNIAETSDKKQ